MKPDRDMALTCSASKVATCDISVSDDHNANPTSQEVILVEGG